MMQIEPASVFSFGAPEMADLDADAVIDPDASIYVALCRAWLSRIRDCEEVD